MKIKIDKILLDQRIRPRSELVPQAIKAYAAEMKEGVEFPPIVVFDGGDGRLVLAHGFHRYRAALKAGCDEIEAEIKMGDIHAAVLYAAGANKDQGEHGVRFSNADKRAAVTMVLRDEEGRKLSSRRIAEIVGINHRTVDELKAKVQVADSATWTVIGRDGKSHPAKRKPKAKKGGDDGVKAGEAGADNVPGADHVHGGPQGHPSPVDGSNGGGAPPDDESHREPEGGDAVEGQPAHGDSDATAREAACESGGSGEGPQDPGERSGVEAAPGGRSGTSGQIDWGEEFKKLRAKTRALVKKFDADEREMNSLLAEIRDFAAYSRLEKESRDLRTGALAFVTVADRVRQKFM